MTRLISRLLLMTLYCMLLDGSRRTARIVRQPYGLKMCEELCKELMDSFTFEKVQLACRCLSRHDSNGFNHTNEASFNFHTRDIGEDTGIPLAHNSTGKQEKAQDPCDTSSQDTPAKDVSKPQSELSAVTEHSGNSEVDQDNDTITLHKACENGNLCIVKYIMSRGLADINCRGKKGRTPVMTAARNGQVEVLQYLVKQGCDMSLFDADNNSVIHVAAIGGNDDIIKELVAKGNVDIESRGWKGMTPVLFAAIYGNEGIFDFLVSKGCSLSEVDNRKANILHAACVSGNVHIVKFILSHDIVNIESKVDALTPLMIAAVKGHKPVIDLLVNKGCNLSAVDQDMNNVLHRSCIEGNVDMVIHILSKDSSIINSRGFRRRTPIMLAALWDRVKVLGFLFRRGCDITLRDFDRNSPIHLASKKGHIHTVKYILSKGIDKIDSKGIHGLTPVMLAAKKGQIKVVEFIISKGCNVTHVDNQGYNLLHMACLSRNVDMVAYIVSKQILDIDSVGFVGRTSVMLAAEFGYKDVVVYLASSGCSMTTLDVNRNNILHVACRGGHVKMVKYILSKDVVSTESRGFTGMTALMIAARHGRRRVFNLLLRNGANTKALDDDRNNILHVACMGGNVDMVKYVLTKFKLRLESANEVGQTPMMVAAAAGQKRVVAFLLSQGSKTSVVDNFKNNILHSACLIGDVDTVKYILSKGTCGIDSRGFKELTPVMFAAREGHRAVFRLLVTEGCNLTVLDKHRNNLLHAACTGGDEDIVECILKRGVVNIDSRGSLGRTPVMIAAVKGQIKVIYLLISRGCDLKAVDELGYKVLHVACLGRNLEIVKYLIELGSIDRNEKTKDGKTAVQIAEERGNFAVIALLRDTLP